jgi:hypothetical protein
MWKVQLYMYSSFVQTKGNFYTFTTIMNMISLFSIILKSKYFFNSLEMPVPSQGHYGFHSFPVVD